MANAIRSHKPLPACPSGLTLSDAYTMLPEVASRVCDVGSCGIKVGLTNPGHQQLFGLDQALLGLLYDWGECHQNAVIPYRDYSQIECQIGIRLGSQGEPASIAPAVEITHLDFSKPTDFNAINMVVCSFGADKFICGDQKPWDHANLEALQRITPRLFRDGQLMLQASLCDAFDGPEKAVDWCLAEADRRKIGVAENSLLLTGSGGGAMPATPGEYVADYGTLGRVAFKIERL